MMILIVIWIMCGLTTAMSSAMNAYNTPKWNAVVDLLVAPILFLILGPMPILARLINKL